MSLSAAKSAQFALSDAIRRPAGLEKAGRKW